MKELLIAKILEDKWMMSTLKAVQKLELPDCWIGAGFLRNKAWDILHQYPARTALSDIDVVFHNPSRLDTKYEEQLTFKLKKEYPEMNWEVINQARTHLWHGDKPYQSTEEAISKWVETATCVGVRLTEKNKIEIIAPYGLDDLKNLYLRHIPTLKDLSIFEKRIEQKQWLRKWPKLSIVRNSLIVKD